MLKIDVLSEINKQVLQLDKEISAIKQEKTSRNCVSNFFNSFKQLFHNELEIKTTKQAALKNLSNKLNTDSFKSAHDFDLYIYSNEINHPTKKGMVFSGLFNRTQKLFNLVHAYLTQQEKGEAIIKQTANFQNKL